MTEQLWLHKYNFLSRQLLKVPQLNWLLIYHKSTISPHKGPQQFSYYYWPLSVAVDGRAADL